MADIDLAAVRLNAQQHRRAMFATSVCEDVLALADEVERLREAWRMAEPVLAERDRLRAAVDAVRARVSEWRKVRTEDRPHIHDHAADYLLDDISAALDKHLGEQP